MASLYLRIISGNTIFSLNFLGLISISLFSREVFIVIILSLNFRDPIVYLLCKNIQKLFKISYGSLFYLLIVELSYLNLFHNFCKKIFQIS
jgi:hypothetical protein